MKKRSLVIAIYAIMLIALTACGKKEEWVFSLNGEKLYDKEITVLGLVYTKEYNIVDIDQLGEYHEEGETYAEFYKKGLEDEILSTVLLYSEAKKEKYKLTKEEEEMVSANAEALVAFYGEDWLKKKDISVSDIETIYEMKQMGDGYVASLSGEEFGEEEQAESREEHYVKVYQVTFPTVRLDENGMVQSDTDGSIMKLSEGECQEMEAAAERFAGQAQAGEDMAELLQEYDRTVTGMEKYLKYEDLDTQYQKEIDGLIRGGISNVIPSAYGYYVVKLLDKNASEHAQLLSSHEAASEEMQEKQDLLDKLYATYVRPDQDYKNEEKWKAVRISSFMK